MGFASLAGAAGRRHLAGPSCAVALMRSVDCRGIDDVDRGAGGVSDYLIEDVGELELVFLA